MQTFFNDTLTISTNTRVAGTDKYTLTASTTPWNCHVQNPTPEETQLLGGKIGQILSCFVESACPADVGNLVTINSVNYKVRAVKRSTWGSVEYNKLLIVKED